MDLEIGYKHYLFLLSDSSSTTQQFVWLQDCVLVHHLCIHTHVSAARWSPPTVVTASRAVKVLDDTRITVRSTISFCGHSSAPGYSQPVNRMDCVGVMENALMESHPFLGRRGVALLGMRHVRIRLRRHIFRGQAWLLVQQHRRQRQASVSNTQIS